MSPRSPAKACTSKFRAAANLPSRAGDRSLDRQSDARIIDERSIAARSRTANSNSPSQQLKHADTFASTSLVTSSSSTAILDSRNAPKSSSNPHIASRSDSMSHTTRLSKHCSMFVTLKNLDDVVSLTWEYFFATTLNTSDDGEVA